MPDLSRSATPTGEAPALLRVAAVRRPHGVRGELRVEPLGGRAERFAAGLVLRREGGAETFVVGAARDVAGGDLLLRLDGVDDLAAAERLRNAYLCVERAQARVLPEGEFFGFELVGMRAVDAQGRDLGEVADLESYSGNDVLLLRDAAGAERRVPFVHAFVRRVDPGAGVVELEPWAEEG